MAKKPSPCPGGRFLVAGGALVAGDSAAPHEPIVVGTTTVSVGEVCPPVTGKLTATRRGTTVKAAWRGCVGLAGPVHLKATFEATCTVLTGTVVARRGSPKRRPFTARRSVCGDGVVDPGAESEARNDAEHAGERADQCRADRDGSSTASRVHRKPRSDEQ